MIRQEQTHSSNGPEWQDSGTLQHEGLERKQDELAEFERSSTGLRYLLPSMVTGLLATPDYIRASLIGTPGNHDKVVGRKLKRQAVLDDASKQFTFILTEQAVRWTCLPPTAMAMQIDRLAAVSLLPSVRLGVIPLDGRMPVAPLNTFTVYDDRIATVETSTGVMVFRARHAVAAYLAEFAVYEEYASFGSEARERLSSWRQLLAS
ncbi:DUF5753 domain-containing protein [Streptomyces sp. KL118A]|uniref:DUF5753 domain-containing protein n=1 Tax=Streptomyces sp. KL118A TaxID=3045153 RepID=UPI00278C3FE8|nr:DUF5753 domain-containing protein [Streptomyces sp. KL118A]